MGRKKHGHCPYAQVEDAPKVLGQTSISKWAVAATVERRTSWLGGVPTNWQEQKIIGRNSVQSTEELNGA